MGKFKRAVEQILLATGNQSVIADGATALVNSSGQCNLASGQLGVFSAGIEGTLADGISINTGDSVSDAPAIEIAVGLPNASLPGPGTYAGFYNKTHLKSHRIFGKMTKYWKGKAYVTPRLNAWVLGADDAATDAIGTPLDETTYSLRVTFKSRRHDEAYGVTTRDSIVASFTTPDYTTLGTVNPLDHLIQNLTSELNKNSRQIVTDGHRGTKPFVALAVRFEGSFSGANSTTNVSDLDSLDGNTTVTGYGFATDTETSAANNNSQMGAAFAAMVADTDADVDTDTQVVALNLTTAGAATSGCNGIIILALDELIAYDDRVEQLKVDLEVAKFAGFGTAVGLYDSSELKEGAWSPRQITILWNDTVGQRGYSQNRSIIPIIQNPPVTDLLSSTGIYDLYLIESEGLQRELVSPDNVSLQRTYIFVPNGSSTTKNGLEAVLNAYFGSVGLPAVNL